CGRARSSRRRISRSTSPRFGGLELTRFRGHPGKGVFTRHAVRSFLLVKIEAESAQGARAGSERRTRKQLARGSVRNVFHILSAAQESRLVQATVTRGLWNTLPKGKPRQKDRVKAMSDDQAVSFLASARTTSQSTTPTSAH